MSKKKEIKLEKLTNNVAYRIIDSTIYLLLNSNTITQEELNIVYKKINLIIEDNELSYINISGKKLEDNKSFFQELGFTLSYYDVNKLNTIYSGIKDKGLYKCYGLMTRNDFMSKQKEKEEKNKEIQNEVVIAKSNSGFVSNIMLLFGGILLLCYFAIQGAIYLVK